MFLNILMIIPKVIIIFKKKYKSIYIYIYYLPVGADANSSFILSVKFLLLYSFVNSSV